MNKSTTIQESPSFIPFCADAPERPDNGKNSHTLELAHLTKLLAGHYKSFCLADFLSLSRSLDITAKEVSEFFTDWSARLVRENKLRRIEGAYSQPIFEVQTKCN